MTGEGQGPAETSRGEDSRGGGGSRGASLTLDGTRAGGMKRTVLPV